MKVLRSFIVLLVATAAYAQCTADRPELAKTLLEAKVIDANRILVHCSHTCDLTFGGDPYRVLDVRELVRNVSTPRGVNQIVILSPAWKVVKTIPYVDQRPLFCRNDQIVIWGELHTPHSTGGLGNTIVFRGPDLDVEFRNTDWASLPSLRDVENQKPKTAPKNQK
jgi:hypothetical protein